MIMAERPDSIFVRSDLDQPLCRLLSPSPPVLTHRPLSFRRSHYRTFSTLQIYSPYVEISSKSPCRLKQRASVGGLQHLYDMGLQFASRSKREQSVTLATLSPASDLPSPLKRSRKKRSIASIFISSDDSDITPVATPTLSTTPQDHIQNLNERPEATVSRTHVSFEDPELVDRFEPKNTWVERNKMKLHPYYKEVPYMQAYDPISLESDRCTDLLLQRLSNDCPTFHDYGRKPPMTVLDLGCGPGHWISHTANVWKNTKFTGFDMVDVTLPAFETTENIQFVQGDFLNYDLPFPDNIFDFVRMANLVLCVPRDKWSFVLGQVYRVLSPGGRLELIDDEIYFPYGELPKEKLIHSAPPLLPAFDDLGHNGTRGRGRDWRNKVPQAGLASGTWSVSSTPGGEVDSMSQPTVRLVRPSLPHYVLRRDLSYRSPTPIRTRWCQPRKLAVVQPSLKTSSRHQRSVYNTTVHNKPSPRRCKHKFRNSLDSKPEDGFQSTSDTTPHNNILASPEFAGMVLGGMLSQSPIDSIASTSTSTPETESDDSSPTWSAKSYSNTSVDSCSPTGGVQTSNTSPIAMSIATSLNMGKERPKSTTWKRKARASRNLERVFERMLTEDFGIHVRPAEFLMDILSKVFCDEGEGRMTQKGRGKVRKLGSYKVKLAPVGMFPGGVVSGKGRGCTGAEGLDEGETKINVNDHARETKKDDSVSAISKQNSRDEKKAREVEKLKVKKERVREKELKGKGSKGGDKKKEGKVDEKSGRGTMVQADEEAAGGHLPAETQREYQVQYSSIAPQVQRLSAKAAVRLGISYSELSAAAASTLPPPRSSTRSAIPFPSSSTGPIQHSGLLIWPSTYIPVGPAELEMHACKYMHTLLGCRTALSEFVAKYKDEEGTRWVGEDEFKDEIWDYECFRRERFNWPSEVNEPHEDHTHSHYTSHVSPTVRSMSESASNNAMPNVKLIVNALEPPSSAVALSIYENESSNPSPKTDPFGSIGGNGKDELLRPMRSHLLSRSPSPSLPHPVRGTIKARSIVPGPFTQELEPVSTSTMGARSPFSSQPKKGSASGDAFELKFEGDVKEDLVHLRTIHVFEGIKAC